MPPNADFTEVKSAAELNPQNPPPFVPSQSGIAQAPTKEEEAMLRATFQQAAAQGMDDLNATVTLIKPAAPQAEQPQAAPTPSIPVPEKFQTPQGTVDEDKLKASSKQLNEAIQDKQKTVEELLAEYKANEKKYWELSRQKSDLERNAPAVPPMPAPPPPSPVGDPQMAQLHQQILADMQRDPVNTSIMLTQALVQKQVEPLMERFRQEEEIRKESVMRDNLAQIAQADPRILHPQLSALMNQILQEDPAMMRLKNPHKAAWNEVKERLRLGDVQTQPSIPSPNLGRGAPPSVSTLLGPMTPNTLYQNASSLNPYSEEGKAFEEKLKEATRQVWQ